MYNNGHIVEKTSGLCIDVKGKENEAQLSLSECKDGVKSLEWEKGMQGKNWFQIKNSLSGKCFDLPDFKTVKKDQIAQLFTCPDEKEFNDNMRFSLVKPADATRPATQEPKLLKEGKLQNIKSPEGEYLCFGTFDEKPSIGSKLGITDCGAANKMVWQRYEDGSLVHKPSGLCLDSEESKQDSPLVLKECVKDKKSQTWS